MASRKTIMVVDDDPEVVRAIRLFLERDYEVLSAGNGEAALAVLGRSRPQLLILDISMPGMSGLEVLERVHASRPALTVLMLTAETDLEVAKRALDRGAAAYITKPFPGDALRVEVKRLLDAPPLDEDERGYRPWRVKP